MENLFIYITDLSSGFAYLAVFLVLVACGLGLPLPEDIPLIAAGYLCWEGTLGFTGAMLVSMAGVLVGDACLYFIGKKVGGALLNGRKAQSFLNAKTARRARAYFRRFGDKIVFFARFVAGFRAAVFFTAGAMKMKFSKFLWLDGLAALLSVPLWLLLGKYLGEKWGGEIEQIFHQLDQFKTVIAIVIGAIVLIVLVRAYLRFQKAKSKG